jgi:AraC-like DNA-binding protein
MDPFLDLIRLLKPEATLFGAGLEAAGKWALSFQKRDDLLFCWIERGECQLFRPDSAPIRLLQGDFVLIRTSTSFTLASDSSTAAADSETEVARTKNHQLRLGTGTENPVTLHAGKFVFNKANQDLVMDLLPSLVHVARADDSSDGVRSLLTMTEKETRSPGPGSEFVIVRLVELLLVEILRSKTLQPRQEPVGLLAGLADPVTARALSAMHKDVAHAWTVDTLAKLCAVSRSTFATRFRAVVGTGPIEYLQRWRMALAKDALRSDTRSIGEIALAIGFQSPSAFSTAFTRAVGCSPTRYAASGQGSE